MLTPHQLVVINPLVGADKFVAVLVFDWDDLNEVLVRTIRSNKVKIIPVASRRDLLYLLL